MNNKVDIGKWLADLLTGPHENLERAIKELEEYTRQEEVESSTSAAHSRQNMKDSTDERP